MLVHVYLFFLVMLDGKEINETSKRFLINWKASKDAARRKQKRQQELYLEDVTSANSLTTVPMLPAIQGPPYAGMGYMVNSGMNPVLRGAEAPEMAVTIPRGAQQLAAVMQRRVPNSTMLNRTPADNFSKSRWEYYWLPKITQLKVDVGKPTHYAALLFTRARFGLIIVIKSNAWLDQSTRASASTSRLAVSNTCSSLDPTTNKTTMLVGKTGLS